MNPILKLLALPVVVVAWLGRDYRVDSQTAGDRIALLALRGEQIPLLRALVKQVGYEAGNLDEMTIGNVLDFIGKRGMEANATDFQSNYVLNQMLRNIPGLMDRWQNIVSSPSNANFAEQLDILLTREEMLERTSGR